MFRGRPIERTHREIVVFFQMNGELVGKIFKRIEGVGSIKIFVVLAVRTLDFAVVTRCEGIDETAYLVLYYSWRLGASCRFDFVS